jgi:hypothetical protein
MATVRPHPADQPAPLTGDDLATIAARLRELADREEIRSLVDRYVIIIDTHDPEHTGDDVYREIFTEDVELVFPIGGYHGVAGLADFETAARTPWAHTHHLAGNYAIDLHGDRATLRAQVIGTHVHPADPPGRGTGPLFVVGCHYDAELARTPDGWRFGYLRLVVDWTAGPGLGTGAGSR